MANLAGTSPLKHVRNFLGCVKSREMPVCNSTVACYGHLVCFAAVSWATGSPSIRSRKSSYVNDDEANATRSYQRRAPLHTLGQVALLRGCLKLFEVGGSTESRPTAIAGG